MSELKSENLKIVALFKKSGKEISSLKFAEAKLKTGEVIMYDGETPLQGAAIAIQTPDGWLPVPDGIIEIEDGTLIEVSGGLIANVKPAEAAAEEAPAAPATTPNEDMDNATPVNPAQEAAIKRTVESVIKETHFTALLKEAIEANTPKVEPTDLTEINTKMSATEATIADLTKSNAELKTQMSALVELLSKAPAEAPAEAPAKTAPNAFKAAELNADEKIMSYLKSQNLK